eukprot:s735_g8.t1
MGSSQEKSANSQIITRQFPGRGDSFFGGGARPCQLLGSQQKACRQIQNALNVQLQSVTIVTRQSQPTIGGTTRERASERSWIPAAMSHLVRFAALGSYLGAAGLELRQELTSRILVGGA